MNVQGGESICVYRGYLIQPYLIGPEPIYYVQKDGFTVASCNSFEQAKQAVEEIIR